jgi:LacI family repressor for deo operon, udp, cdd, tsx, nupC, and nupG
MGDGAAPVGEANMADVARAAGVSIATVSRALRDVPGVSEPTRERIRRVAQELSYVISPEASALSRGQTGRVAIVMPHLDAWFYSAMIASMAPVLRAAELDMLVYQVEGEKERTRFLRELPARRKVDAVILTALPMAQAEVERLDLLGVHVVVAGGRLGDYPHVLVDDLAAGRAATQHLVDLGHRRIGMIRTSDTDGTAWSSDLLRVQAWRETLETAGLEAADQLLVTESYGVGAGASAMARLLALAEPPTAVFAYSDELAFAAIAHARSVGLRVPEDLSVLGIDGHPLGELFGVTTVDQDVASQGRLAAELAVRLVSGEREVSDVHVATRLIDRGSTTAV